MLDELEHLTQFRFGARAGQLHGPAQVALRRIQLSQRGQFLGMQIGSA